MRPLTGFGHEAVLERLRTGLDEGGFQRTLLFSGPDGVGRRLAAGWLCAYLNCLALPEERPCGVCASCRAVMAGESLDYKEVSPVTTARSGRARHKGEVRIGQLVTRPQDDEPDPLGPWLAARPFGRYRVGVIDDAHTMNANAANAFLKTLEEPPARAFVILIAPGPETLLPTVASRAVNLRFGAVPVSGDALPGHPGVRLGQPGLIGRALENLDATEAARLAAEEFVSSVRGDMLHALEGAEDLAKAVTAAQGSGAEPGPLGWLRESMRSLPAPAYAAALDELDGLEDALAAYANPGLACATLAIALRGVLARAADPSATTSLGS